MTARSTTLRLPSGARVGVIGATGLVGRATTKQLADWGCEELKLGVRRPEQVAIAPLSGRRFTVETVDAMDSSSLVSFLRNVDCVINCTGPAATLGMAVSEQAALLGVDVIDVNGDRAAKQRIGQVISGVRIVLACGMMPGLSAALPAWAIAHHTRSGHAIAGARLLVGGRDRISRAAAHDIVHAARARQGLWTVRSEGISAAHSHDLFPDASTIGLFDSGSDALAAYDDEELQGLRESVSGCRFAGWAVHAGPASRRALLQTASGSSDIRIAAQLIADASEADCAGRQGFQQLVVDTLMWESMRLVPVFRAHLRAVDASSLSAAALAIATMQVLCGNVDEGVHLGADILRSDECVNCLLGCAGVLSFSFGPHGSKTGVAAEEGVL